jgi:hypothetical protein
MEDSNIRQDCRTIGGGTGCRGGFTPPSGFENNRNMAG